jgi:hypothetical protein
MYLAVDYHAAPDLAVSEMHLPWHTHICGMPRSENNVPARRKRLGDCRH